MFYRVCALVLGLFCVPQQAKAINCASNTYIQEISTNLARAATTHDYWALKTLITQNLILDHWALTALGAKRNLFTENELKPYQTAFQTYLVNLIFYHRGQLKNLSLTVKSCTQNAMVETVRAETTSGISLTIKLKKNANNSWQIQDISLSALSLQHQLQQHIQFLLQKNEGNITALNRELLKQ